MKYVLALFLVFLSFYVNSQSYNFISEKITIEFNKNNSNNNYDVLSDNCNVEFKIEKNKIYVKNNTVSVNLIKTINYNTGKKVLIFLSLSNNIYKIYLYNNEINKITFEDFNDKITYSKKIIRI